ncbi:MAG TPA: universal stress protein [Trebonia sp.]|nr:universal stress protein [Trebonia sp.]
MTTVRRIVVGVHGSLGSLQALRYAADEARERGVPLAPVIAWVPPGGDFAERGHPSPYLRQMWREAARDRLSAAFDDGLGGVPGDMRIEPRVERGETGPVLVDVADKPGDLLVIGTGRRSLLARALRKSVGRYLLAHAKCPVVAVPPSSLMDEMRRPRPLGLPWPLRRRPNILDTSDISELSGK